LAVMIVLVVLALAGYQYSEMTLKEYQATQAFERAAQARLYAESGLNWAMAALATPETITEWLGGHPYNNPDSWENQALPVGEGSRLKGRFSVSSPVDPTQPASDGRFYRPGVADEGGKIDINGLMKLDPTGNRLQ